MKKERDELKAEFGELYDQILSTLFHYDLMGISQGFNFDEYAPEVDTILPRLAFAKNHHDVHYIVYDEFCDWFGACTVAQ